jgi:hypothetical protein
MGVRVIINGKLYKAVDGSMSKDVAKRMLHRWKNRPEIKFAKILMGHENDFGTKYTIFVHWIPEFEGYEVQHNKPIYNKENFFPKIRRMK